MCFKTYISMLWLFSFNEISAGVELRMNTNRQVQIDTIAKEPERNSKVTEKRRCAGLGV